jgi:hypothetical protein
VVITMPGRLCGPAIVPQTAPEMTAPLRAVKMTGVITPYPLSPQS